MKVAQIQARGKRHAQDDELPARLTALEQDVTALRRELAEAHERIDFTERLLARDKEAKRLGGND